MMERVATWPIKMMALGGFVVIAGLAFVVWLSFTLAADNRADRERDCMARNEGREDVANILIFTLNTIDADRSSPLWQQGPPSPDFPNGRPPIDVLIRQRLSPINCNNLE